VKHNLQRSGSVGFLVFVMCASTAFAQPPHLQFQHLSDVNGLSNNRVWAITQDKYGLIWVGTQDGLNRFDGYKVDVYRREPGNKNSLPDNYVRCLFTDSYGTVWIGTSSGLAYYDYRTNSFQSFLRGKGEDSLPGNSISVIKEDVYGIVWIGTHTGLCSFDIKKKRFQRFLSDDHSNSISSDHIRDIDFAPDGTMWITTGKGLNRLDLSTMRFTSFFHDPKDTTTLSGNILTQIAMDKNGNIWTSVNESVFLECFNTKTYRVSHYRNFTEKQSHIPNNTPRDIFIDGKGRLWIGTDQAGLYLFIPGKNIFYQYRADILDPNKMQSNTIVGMYQDKSNMIWLATNTGAERFNPDESKFIVYRPQPITSLPLANNSVQAIAEDPSYRLWIGTFNGIFILDRKTGAYTNYQFKADDPHTLSNNVVQSICRDKRGNMWIGTMGGLNLFDPVQKRFRRFYTRKDDVRGIAFIHSIVSCKNGDLFFGGQGGLSKFDFENDSVRQLSNEGVTVIFEDNREILWIGVGGGSSVAGGGLLRYNRSTGERERFFNIADDTSSLPSNNIGSIAQDQNGVIWIGTGAGLARYNNTTRKFTTFSEKNGLPNVQMGQLLVDDKNRIWMSTNRGISMLNEPRTKFTHYDRADGLQGREFGGRTVVKTYDGYLCYGGRNGFNIFHPDSLRINNFIPQVILRRIMIFDDELKVDSFLTDLKKLKLSYKQNFFSFEFAALNYDHPEKNQYAYQLINFDKKPVLNGTNRVFSYTNVPPGHYTLKVTASNNDNQWNKAGFELELIIIPPFWATWWFKTIVVLVLAGSLLLFFKLRENRIRKEEARQTTINKQIAEIRMTALRGQMNPHFIFNSLNSIQHFITTRDKGEALNYLSKFSKLIRQILENSRENTVSISNELQLLELYIQLEQLRFSNKFDYHIEIDEKIDMENTEIPPLLIQPYIENAILHGLINKNGKGDLWFSLERHNGLLVCKIEDNGIGRARAQQIEEGKISRHKSLGIKVTEERISGLFALLDYKMEVVTEDLFETKQALEETPQPAGTRVTISIPVKEEE
jgi:ligand-binding sensor domain-containing protein